MPAHCCAYGCKNRQIPGVDLKFYRIPRDHHLRAKWVSAIKRDDWKPTEHSRICSKHFINGQPSRDPTNPDFVPTVFSHRAVPESILQEKVQRHQRLLERKENIAKNESAQVLLSLSQEEPLCVTTGTSTQTPVQSVCEMAVQTEISLPVMTGLIVTNQYLKSVCDKTAETCAELKQEQELLQRKCEEHVKDIEMLKASLQRLEEENKFLRDDVEKKTLSFQNLKGDDRRTKFYTGFPNFETLSAVLSVTSTKVKRRSYQKKMNCC